MSLRDLPRWALLAKEHKQQWMACGPPHEAVPALIPEWEDGPLAIILVMGAKEAIYKALRLIRFGIDPVAVTLVQEAYVALCDLDDPATVTLRRGMEDGSVRLADLAASGGLARGEVGEWMIAHHVLRDGSFELAMIPFARVGSRIAWDDRRARLMPGASGAYPVLVKEAMNHPTFLSSPEYRREMQSRAPGVMTEQDSRLIVARGVLAFLHAQPEYHVAPIRPDFADLGDPDPGGPDPARRAARPDPARAQSAKKKR